MNSVFLQVMVFYALITYLIFPAIGYYLNKVKGAGNGFVVGSIVSLVLWFMYGKPMSLKR